MKKKQQVKVRNHAVMFMESKRIEEREFKQEQVVAESMIFLIMHTLLKAFAVCVAAFPSGMLSDPKDPNGIAFYDGGLSFLMEVIESANMILRFSIKGDIIATYDKNEMFFGPQFTYKHRLEMLTKLLIQRFSELPELSGRSTGGQLPFPGRESYLKELKIIKDAISQDLSQVEDWLYQ